MEIYLIRHTSVDIPAGYAYGHTDVPLRSSFEQEAEIVKNNLKEIVFDAVWSSPLNRCTRLASYCGYPDAVKDDRIKEINFGDWEMKSWEEISAEPQSTDWLNDWLNVSIPGGESFADQYKRVCIFLNEVRRSNYNKVAVFAHGGVLICARIYAGEFDKAEAFKHLPAYGEIMKLEFDAL